MLLIRVALAVGVNHGFDYLPPATPREAPPAPGTRVAVPFGRRHLVGIVVAHVDAPETAKAGGRYKAIERVIDDEPLLSPPLLDLCLWCTAYYQYPVGQVIATALPARLRGDSAARYEQPARFTLTPAGRAALPMLPARNVAQRALLERLTVAPATRTELGAASGALARARVHGWISVTAEPPAKIRAPADTLPSLTTEQAAALAKIETLPAGYSATLLDGVTGSGKTELYLRLAQRVVDAGRQVLALAPEIGLTPQLVARFEQRFGERVACYHSGMGDAGRLRSWLAARAGHVDIVVGTRSAAFMPLARPGLLIVDEEHDGSYKQQDGLRYSARDLAVLRAHRLDIPIVLGSATPSLESLHNAASGRYHHVQLTTRVNARPAPAITLLDMRRQTLDAGLSDALLATAARHLQAGGQVLFFINRRGFAPVLMCHQCGWAAPCPDCDARLTLHRRAGRLVCHHCGHTEAPPATCPGCGHTPLTAIGQGTERIEDALRRHFPGQRVERIDSDRTRSAGTLESLFDAVHQGDIRILVGTQILAKGHDFPGLTLAGLVDVDAALYGSDFRALEHMAQLITQVAGRVGRGTQAGEVILQTHAPDHPQLQRLVEQGYAAATREMLAERQTHGLPPFTRLALLRAEAPARDAPLAFLRRAATVPVAAHGIERLGPIPAPMERRAGRYRAQLLIRAQDRPHLHTFLDAWLPQLRGLRAPRSLRWSIDVDPADLY